MVALLRCSRLLTVATMFLFGFLLKILSNKYFDGDYQQISAISNNGNSLFVKRANRKLTTVKMKQNVTILDWTSFFGEPIGSQRLHFKII